VLRENECVRNRSWGIYFGDGSGGTAEKNTCSENVKDGIAVVDYGTDPRLTGNVCRSNRDDGIHFGADTGGSARDNRCEKNVGYGIHAHSTTRAKFSGNLCRENEKGDVLGKVE
jgi:parallel beta-helix repeat protein